MQPHFFAACFFLFFLSFSSTTSQAQPVLLSEILTPDNKQSVATAVIYVYESQSKTSTVTQQCWESLVSQRTLELRAVNSQSFLRKHLAPITGAAMGAAAGGWLLHRHAAPDVASKWIGPTLAISGLGGYLGGPFGVLGAVAGGALADKYGHHNRAKTLGGGLAAAAAGKALWDAIFPDPTAAADVEGEISADTFVRETLCGPYTRAAYSDPRYQIGYEFNGVLYSAEVDFEPGEAVFIDPDTGVVQAPAPRQ